MDYTIGQTFENTYPPEAAIWSNANGARLAEKEQQGKRIFVIEEIPPQQQQQPTEEEIVNRYAKIVQKMLDDEAKKLNYDSCLSVCSYYETGYPKFDVEGAAFRAWRSAVWVKAYAILDEVKAGTRAQPTYEELLAELPPLVIEYPEA